MIQIKPNNPYSTLNAAAEKHFQNINPVIKGVHPISKKQKFHGSWSVIGKLKSLINDTTDPAEIDTLLLILKNIDNVIKGEPKILNDLIKEIGEIPDGHNLHEPLERVFQYDYFRDHKAFDFIQLLNVPVCPYCNRNFLSVINTKKKKQLLFHIDHYFPKGKYPYLRLSFHNLIPSCAVCNSHLKAFVDFELKYHLHPFKDNFNSILRFQTNIKDLSIYFTNKKRFHISLVPRRDLIKPVSRKQEKKAKRVAKVFRITELYNTHKDFVQELIQRKLTYPDDFVKDMFEKYKGTYFQTEEEAARMFLGNYITEDEIDRRPLSKFIKDISQEFKLI